MPPAYYVILVRKGKYILDLGSAQGITVGMKLAVYKKAAPTVKVGELQVTDVVAEHVCQARLLTPGVTVDPNDIVRVE